MQEIASYSKVIAPYKKSVHLTPDHASFGLINWPEALDFIGLVLCENVA